MDMPARLIPDTTSLTFRDSAALPDVPIGQPNGEPQPARRNNLVLVVEDQPSVSAAVGAICAYVGLTVEAISAENDLGLLLDERRPLAVIAPFESDYQDGAHVLKAVATHDRELAVMILTGRNPAWLGAAEAMRETLQLSQASLPNGEPSLGQMVEFLAQAAHRNRRRRHMAEGGGK